MTLPDDDPDPAPAPGPSPAPSPPPTPTERAVEEIEAFLLGGPPTLTRVEVAARVGVPLELAEQLWRQLGFPHHTDDDVAFADSDVEALRLAVEMRRLGVLNEESQAALVRTWGRSYARLAEWQTTLLADLAVQGPDPDERLSELAAATLPGIEMLQSYVWRRHLASAANRLLTDESTSAGEALLTVCFVDIVGYTSASKSLDQRELVDWIERFEQDVTALVVDHAGHVIKTIGDEVLFTVSQPADAVAVAIELTARGEDGSDGFPRVRAGVAHGPVVRRLGDVFGPTVNVASRLTSVARPGTVVTDAAVHEALTDDEDTDGDALRWSRLRRLSVKGYSRLEAWRVKPGKDAG